MECPNCKLKGTEELGELSRGMGNQVFFKCPACGTVALWSGEVLTQYWPPADGQEGGNECRPLAHIKTSTNVS